MYNKNFLLLLCPLRHILVIPKNIYTYTLFFLLPAFCSMLLYTLSCTLLFSPNSQYIRKISHFICTLYRYWRREWQPTPVFLPGKFHAQRSLAGYLVHGAAKLDTEQLNYHQCDQILKEGFPLCSWTQKMVPVF